MTAKMGRPTKQTDERLAALFQALEIGNTRTASAQAAGISLGTFNRWMDDEDFRDKVTRAESTAELRFLGQVAKHAMKSPQAAMWWLERRRPADYRQRTAVEMTGADGGPMEFLAVTSNLNDHERELLRDLIDGVLKEQDPLLITEGVVVE